MGKRREDKAAAKAQAKIAKKAPARAPAKAASKAADSKAAKPEKKGALGKRTSDEKNGKSKPRQGQQPVLNRRQKQKVSDLIKKLRVSSHGSFPAPASNRVSPLRGRSRTTNCL